MRQVKQLLENWGIWARCRVGTEFPSVAAGMSEAVEWESQEYRGEWNDDMAMAVDRAVAELGQFDSELRELMLQHYVCSASARHLARAAGVHHAKVSRNIERGDMWVAAKLF
ncbi:MAG: antiterminator Q family protein [Oceanisphaera sp.]|uniref:antiterminator Q family protein n=1 Tax=Oceanisphaera sp. TaxID=1929979 RepID=UPI003C76577A